MEKALQVLKYLLIKYVKKILQKYTSPSHIRIHGQVIFSVLVFFSDK